MNCFARLSIAMGSRYEKYNVLLGSLAQEESFNLSQITRMGIAYRFQEGKVLVNHNKFLGYTKNENGELVIVHEEAEVVRRIFREFLDGKSPYKIAVNLLSQESYFVVIVVRNLGVLNGAKVKISRLHYSPEYQWS